MTFLDTLITRKIKIAQVLLLIFAFSAWSLTGPANIALLLLTLLFLTEIPSHWHQLRREPALLLFAGVLVITSILALRAAWLFPATANEQWLGISAWVAPFLFIVPAWWLRREPRLILIMLTAAGLGLAFGILRKTDWSLAPQFLQGMRYDFGYTAVGIAFLASVALLGLLVFRARITDLKVSGHKRPLLGWILWSLGFSFLLAVLIITQSRGAALGLAMAGLLYGGLQWRSHHCGGESPGYWPITGRTLISVALITILAALLLWSTKGRELEDSQISFNGGQGAELSYTGSINIRLNLLQVGLAAFVHGPLLGFGPGTSTTEFLVPEQVIRVGIYHRVHAPEHSHLHSAALEILARFGLVGVLIALLLAWVLMRAYHRLWRDPRASPDLRMFLTICGAMLIFFCLYDFRLMNVDLRFFLILIFGMLYCFQFEPLAKKDQPLGG